MKIIKINNTDYKFKPTIRAMFIFEKITGKSFSIDNLLDNYIYFYSMLLANNPDVEILSWDEFIDAIDNDSTILTQLTKLSDDTKYVNDLMSDENSEDEKSENEDINSKKN